jgi:3-phosphoshikimate 1-carboxyvinyltransferase
VSYRVVKSGRLVGEIVAPPSKSQTLRSILFGSLAKGKTVIDNYLLSPDTNAMVEGCRLLGAKIAVTPKQIIIEGTEGKIAFAEDVIYAGNSGIVLRFCTAIGALSSKPVVLTGDKSIRYQRPMKQLLKALRDLGVKASSMRGDDYAPVIIEGPMKAGVASLSGEDSQPVSALLIAAAFSKGPVEINVENPGEKPWIALTLSWFQKLKIPYEQEGFTRYRMEGSAKVPGFAYTPPGDFSSAAFPIAAALITNSALTVKNLDMEDPQGDKALIFVLQKMGAKIEIDEDSRLLRVEQGGRLTGITVDVNDFVDAVTILAVIACYASGKTFIKGAAVAREKECNRLKSIAEQLGKMGGEVSETEDGLEIIGGPLKGAHVDSCGDHRMAMSLVIAALGAEGETLVSSTQCISKTFPSFFQDFQSLGANMEEL